MLLLKWMTGSKREKRKVGGRNGVGVEMSDAYHTPAAAFGGTTHTLDTLQGEMTFRSEFTFRKLF